MKRKVFSLTSLVAVGLIFASTASRAGVIYQWVCDDASCNGDPAFASTLEISTSAFAAGTFTGVAGNVLSWTTTSGIGDGYTLSLSDMLSGSPGSNTDDVNNLQMVLSSNRSEVSGLFDISAGTNITFFDASIGRVDFFEGNIGSYSVGSLQDLSPATVISSINVRGRFVRVPEPSTLALFGIGFAGLRLARHRNKS